MRKIYSYITLSIGLMITGSLLTSNASYAQTPPPPSGALTAADLDTIGNCKIKINSDSIESWFTVTRNNAPQNHIITWTKKSIKKDDSETGRDGIHLFTVQKTQGVNSTIDADQTDVFQMPINTPEFGTKASAAYYLKKPSFSDTQVVQTEVLFSSTNQSQITGDYTDALDPSNNSNKTFFQKSIPNTDTNNTFGRFVEFLNNPSTTCSLVNGSNAFSQSSFLAHNQTTSTGDRTVSITQTDSSGKSSDWYLVAHGNWRNNTGFIYRQGTADNYLMVGGSGDLAGRIIATFTPAQVGKDWDNTANGTVISSFNNPVPIISASETFNHFKLPSGSGSKIQINFPTTLTDPGDLNTKTKYITIEAQLNNATGPYINKDTLGLLDDPPGSGNYKQSVSDSGFKDDMFILEQKDLGALYGTVPQSHLDALITNIVICGHKALNAGFASGFVNLKLTDADHHFSVAPGDIKVIADQGDGVQDWTSKTDPLVISAAKNGSQTCGSAEDTTVADKAAAGISQGGDVILKAIINALKAIGTLIQNFIIYVVEWLVALAETYVPI